MDTATVSGFCTPGTGVVGRSLSCPVIGRFLTRGASVVRVGQNMRWQRIGAGGKNPAKSSDLGEVFTTIFTTILRSFYGTFITSLAIVVMLFRVLEQEESRQIQETGQ